MTLRIAAVVLAGGEGRRMGGGKPLRIWRGRTLLAQALEKAQAYAPVVAVAVRAPDQVGDVGVPVLTDRADIEGPLAGLASAITFARDQKVDAVLTLPCDAPLLPLDLGARLADALAPGIGVALAQSHSHWQPTCGLWRANLAEALVGYSAAGGRSLRGFAEAAGLRLVDWGAPEPDPFANLNTRQDLERLGGG